MNKHKTLLALFCILLTFFSCYTDDGTPPNPARLPFEDFNEFFEANNAAKDTFSFLGSIEATLLGSQGTKVFIPANTFSESGELFIAIKEAIKKSDLVLTDKKTTMGGNSVLESSGTLSLDFFNSTGNLTLNNPVEVRFDLMNGAIAEDQSYFYYENDWSSDAEVEISEVNNELTFETDRRGWQMIAENSSFANDVNLTINPLGYGSIPHDMRVYVVFTDSNVVLSPFSYDISNVKATGSIPAGVEMNLLVMVMDHFKLSAGIQTINLSEDETIDFQLDIMTVDEMIDLIKTVD